MKIRPIRLVRQVAVPVLMILLAFVFSAVVMLFTGGNPFVAYKAMFVGAFGSLSGWITTINRAIPICICGFGVAFSRKCGLFNIGLEGQLLMGALGSTIAGIYFTGLPIYLHLPISLLFGMLFGMLWSVVPAVLYIEKKQNLVVSLLFMNIIAGNIIQYFVFGPMMGKGAQQPSTDRIAETARFPFLLSRPAKLSSAVLLAVLVGVLLHIYMKKTYSGYELRATGGNRSAAKFAGINTKTYLYLAILIPGILGGMAGAIDIQSRYFRIIDGFSPGYGWDALPIALLSGGNPIAVILGSLLFAGMYVGASSMQLQAGISSQIISVVQGFLVIAVSLDSFIRFVVNKKLFRKKNTKKSTESEASVS